MRQEQIQRKRHARNGPDDNGPDDIPTETPEHASKASQDAADLIARIDHETS